MTNSQPVREEQTSLDWRFLSVAPVPNELPLVPKDLPQHGNAGLLRKRLNTIASSAPIVSPDFTLERGDTGMLLSQLDALSNPPVALPKPILERGDTGLLLSALDALSNPPVTLEEFVLERGDTGLLLSELSALSKPPVTFEEFVLERSDTGMFLSQLSALSNPLPVELMTIPREPNLLTPEMLAIKARAYEPESSIFYPKEPAPITYTSNIDREFDTQKWLIISVIAISTLLLGCGAFSQLRFTGLSNHPNVPLHPSKSQ